MLGVLESIDSREVNTRRGPAAVYNVVIGGKKYGAGFNKPPAEVGQTVEFDASQNQKGYWDAKNIRVTAAVAPPAAPAGNGGNFGGGSSYNDREMSILIQSCRKDAIAGASALLAAGALPLGQKKGEMADVFWAYVQNITEVLYKDTRAVIDNGGFDYQDAPVADETDDEIPF